MKKYNKDAYNVMCAKFLKFKTNSEKSRWKPTISPFKEMIQELHGGWLTNNLKFDSDWIWIMEVCDKIGSLKDPDPSAKWDINPFQISIGYKYAHLDVHPQYYMLVFKNDDRLDDAIDGDEKATTKKAVVDVIWQFLNWYNEKGYNKV